MSGHDSILEVLQEDVKRAPSGHKAEQIAALMGKGYSTLMNELNGSIPGHKFGLLQLIPLMQATGSRRALDFLCGAMGCVCIRLPRSGRGHSTTERDAIDAVRQFGELMVVDVHGHVLGDVHQRLGPAQGQGLAFGGLHGLGEVLGALHVDAGAGVVEALEDGEHAFVGCTVAVDLAFDLVLKALFMGRKLVAALHVSSP